MKKIDCDIIKDLLPLYTDEVISESGRAAVEEHLIDCENCRKEYKEMSGDLELPMEIETKMLRTLNQKLRMKKIGTIICSVLGTIFIIFVMYFLITEVIYWDIPYDENIMAIEELEDGSIQMAYLVESGISMSLGFSMEKNNSGKDVLIVGISYQRNFYEKYLKGLFRSKGNSISEMNKDILLEGNDLREYDEIKIYYVDSFLYKNIKTNKPGILDRVEKEAVLLWEK